MVSSDLHLSGHIQRSQDLILCPALHAASVFVFTQNLVLCSASRDASVFMVVCQVFHRVAHHHIGCLYDARRGYLWRIFCCDCVPLIFERGDNDFDSWHVLVLKPSHSHRDDLFSSTPTSPSTPPHQHLLLHTPPPHPRLNPHHPIIYTTVYVLISSILINDGLECPQTPAPFQPPSDQPP